MKLKVAITWDVEETSGGNDALLKIYLISQEGNSAESRAYTL